MEKMYQPPYILCSTLYGAPSAFEFHAKKYTNFSSEHPYRRRVLWRIRRFNIFLLYTEFAYRRRRLLLNIYGQSIPTSTTPISCHVLIPTLTLTGSTSCGFETDFRRQVRTPFALWLIISIYQIALMDCSHLIGTFHNIVWWQCWIGRR